MNKQMTIVAIIIVGIVIFFGARHFMMQKNDVKVQSAGYCATHPC